MFRPYSYRKSKMTTDMVPSLDIRIIINGLHETGAAYIYSWSDSAYLKFRCNQNRLTIEDNNQEIALDRANCNYGGSRTWFLCPKCNKRAAILYNRDRLFFCRQCQNLSFSSQREGDVDRLVRKLRKIRKRLGASSDISEPIIFRPKGMHWNTFENLITKENEISQKYAQAVIDYLGLINFR